MTGFYVLLGITIFFFVLTVLISLHERDFTDNSANALILGCLFGVFLLLYSILHTPEERTIITEACPSEYEIMKGDYSYSVFFPETRQTYVFTSAEFYHNYSEDTKFFIRTSRSIVGIKYFDGLVWSNPPYKMFRKE